jgi:hypothetical protein
VLPIFKVQIQNVQWKDQSKWTKITMGGSKNERTIGGSIKMDENDNGRINQHGQK